MTAHAAGPADAARDAALAAAVGVPWLLAAIAPAGDFGRRARERRRPFAPGSEAQASAAIAEVASLARADDGALGALRDAIARAPDPGAALARAAAGGTIGDADLFDVARLLDALAEIAERAAACGVLPERAPRPDGALAAALEPGRTAGRGFYLADAFAPGLGRARAAASEAAAASAAARGHLAARAAAALGEERLRDGEFTVLRERLALGLPPEVRIVREAAGYAICALALDAPALAALAAAEAAAAVVAREEDAARAALSATVGARAAPLAAACEATGELDLLVAAARFARRHACVAPELAAAPEIALAGARLLPLEAELAAAGRAYEPIDVELAGVGVVTGANMGGKSALLRTVGFACACAALGLPVPARSARVPLAGAIVWLGTGGEAPGGLLSAFGAEIAALRAFLDAAPARPLVLVDEFARTTSPREGRALLVALVEALRARGCLALVATHLAGVAAAAGAPHFAVGTLREAPEPGDAPLPLARALERIAAATDYRVYPCAEDGRRRSDALALAAALGLDAGIVGRAREVLEA